MAGYIYSKGGETTIDLDQNDGEVGGTGTGVIGSGVTIVAHAISGAGARCFEMDMATTKSKGHVQVTGGRSVSGSATKQRINFWVELDAVTTPAFDVPIWRDNAATTRYELRWSRLTDNKIHLYDGGTEIDSANAFTPPSVGSAAFGTGFAIRITFLIASPFTITVETATSTTSPTTFTTHQSGAGASAPPTPVTSYFGEDLGSGVNHNWKMRLDNVVGEDDSITFTDEILDVVIDGVPTSDSGTHNDFSNSAGTTCSTAVANCYAEVDEGIPPSTADYVQYTGTGADDRQSWPTSSSVLASTDTVLGVRAALHMTRGSPAGSGGFQILIVDGGTDCAGIGGTPPAAGSTKWCKGDPGHEFDSTGTTHWTVAKATASEVGYEIALPASNPAIRINAAYKIIIYKIGAPAAATGRSFAVII